MPVGQTHSPMIGSIRVIGVTVVVLVISFLAFPAPWKIWWAVPALCAIAMTVWSGMSTVTDAASNSRSVSSFIASAANLRAIMWVAVIALLCGFGDGKLDEGNRSLDILGSLAVVVVLAYFGMGSAVVVENERRIALQDEVVESVRTEQRSQSRIAFSYLSRVSSIQPTTPLSKSAVDLLARKIRTVELALARSHGGGVGTLDRGPMHAFSESDLAAIGREVDDLESLIQNLEDDSDSLECCKSAMSHVQKIERRLMSKGLI